MRWWRCPPRPNTESADIDRRRDLLHRRAISRRVRRCRATSAALAELAHEQGALLVVVMTEAVSFGALRSPGSMGADIVVAEGQSIGNGLNFGGPYLGLFATRQKFLRQMPGRLCGETVDEDGKRGFVLTLSTREQHIRRDKATSNICTNSGLCCARLHDAYDAARRGGLAKLAARSIMRTPWRLADQLGKVPGVEIVTPHFFNEFTIRTPKPGAEVIDALVDEGVIGGVPAARLFPGEAALDDLIIVAATEINTAADREAYAARARKGACMTDMTTKSFAKGAGPATLHRQSRSADRGAADLRDRRAGNTAASISRSRTPFESRLGDMERATTIGLPGLTEPETMRHYVRLSQKNYSIDTGIFPLGSCTMKHNPRLNEKMARLPGFGDIHPLQPQKTVQGAIELMAMLSDWLTKLTGMPAVALSPKAGAHGELCGMIAIRAALEARGEADNAPRRAGAR